VFYTQANRPDAPPRLRQVVTALGDTPQFAEEVSEDGVRGGSRTRPRATEPRAWWGRRRS